MGEEISPSHLSLAQQYAQDNDERLNGPHTSKLTPQSLGKWRRFVHQVDVRSGRVIKTPDGNIDITPIFDRIIPKTGTNIQTYVIFGSRISVSARCTTVTDDG